MHRGGALTGYIETREGALRVNCQRCAEVIFSYT